MNKPSDEFQPRDAGDNSARINRFIEEFENQSITLDNYDKVVSQVESNNNLIDSQVENSYLEYVKLKNEFVKIRDSEYYKEMKERKIIDLEVFELGMKMRYHMQQMLSWKYLQNDMNNLFFRKLVETLREAKSFDIKRDALKEMREMETKRNELFLEVMKSRNQSADEHLMSGVKEIQRIQKISEEKNYKIMSDALLQVADSLVQSSKYNSAMIEKVLGRNDATVFHETNKNSAQQFAGRVVAESRGHGAAMTEAVSYDYDNFETKPVVPVQKVEQKKAIDEFSDFGPESSDDDFMKDFKNQPASPLQSGKKR